MSEPETIEGEVQELVGQALEVAVAAPQPVNLFRTEDPAEVIRRATAVAETLKHVLVEQNLISVIRDREHVRVEGWTLLGTMLGVFPVCTWTRKLDDGWEARVEARTMTGAVVGAAEAECLRSEKEWGPNPSRGKPKDDYALRSMAQTRATSKALRQPLGFVVTLAGFEATPAEEVGSDAPENSSVPEHRVEDAGPTPIQRSWTKVYEQVEKAGGNVDLFKEFVREASYLQFGTKEFKDLTADQKKVMLQKSAGASVWLIDNPDTPIGSSFSHEHMRAAWASVLNGVLVQTPDWKDPTPDAEVEPPDDEAARIADQTFEAPEK